MTRLRRHWFLIGLCSVIVVGVQFAPQLRPIAEAAWLRQLLVVSVLFATSLPLQLEGIKRMVQSPGGTLLACVVSWLLIPLLALPVVNVWGGDLGLGLMVAATAPGTLASAAVWTRVAGGNELIPIAVCVVTNLLACIVIPMWLDLLAISGELGEVFHPVTAGRRLMVLVVVPMLAAQFARLRGDVARWADQHHKRLSTFAQAAILVVVMIGAIQCGLLKSEDEAAFRLPSLLAVMGVTSVLHVLGLLCGIGLARGCGFDAADRTGIAFAGSQKTLMVGLQVAFLLGGGLILLPMVVYHVMQLIIDAWLASQWSLTAASSDGPNIES